MPELISTVEYRIDFDRACKIIEIKLNYQNKKSKDDVCDEIDKLYKELEENENALVI